MAAVSTEARGIRVGEVLLAVEVTADDALAAKAGTPVGELVLVVLLPLKHSVDGPDIVKDPFKAGVATVAPIILIAPSFPAAVDPLTR